MGGVDWSNYDHAWVQAKNPSRGFHAILFSMLEHYGAGRKCCLVNEPNEVLPIFKARFPKTAFTILAYDPKNRESDLNIARSYKPEFDSVFSQATLEHLCRPSIAVENMAGMCRKGGHLVVHASRYSAVVRAHRFPLACAIFMEDFWADLCRYLPIKMLAYAGWRANCFVVYRKKREPAGR